MKFTLKSLSMFVMLIMALFAYTASVQAEQFTKDGAIVVVAGSSNTAVVVDCIQRGVGRAQANEIVKLAFYNPNTTTASVDFAIQELDGTTYTTIASQTFTAGSNLYVTYTPFKFYAIGNDGTGTNTNYASSPYSAKSLRISVNQSATNATAVTKSYTYEIITR